MRDNRCPNCDNDLSDVVASAIVSRVKAGGDGPEPVICPHCQAELSVTVLISTSLSRQEAMAY